MTKQRMLRGARRLVSDRRGFALLAVLLGVFFCTSVIVVLFNLMTDLLYALIDPRVEVGG
jgi:ABC-type dipeptide/oligopeptide/nickel transport system permease component